MKENLIPNKAQLYEGWEVRCPVKGGGHLEHIRGLLRLEMRQVPYDDLEDLEELEDDEDDEVTCETCGLPLDECECDEDECDEGDELEECPNFGRGCKACRELHCIDPRLNVDYTNTMAEVLDVYLDGELLEGIDVAPPAIARYVNQVCWANGL